MRRLDRYILKECAGPLAFTLIAITAIVWMTQSLQRIDVIVEDGAGLGAFAFLSVLIVPSLLAVIIPFAIFAAAVYALYRLHADSEIAVMFAAGVGRWRLAAPILALAIAAMLATLYVNVDLMPRSYRVLKQMVANIRADVASAVLREGEFTTFMDGMTVYVDETRPGGQLVGLLVNDYRDADDRKTYIAERAVLRDGAQGAVLSLRNGSVQSRAAETGALDVVRFEEVAINIDALREAPGELVLELTERYPGELLNPDMSKGYDRKFAARLKAEGHARFAGPLYAVAYVMAALVAMIGGAYSRRGYLLRIAAAAATVFGLRIVGYVAQGFVETNGAYWLLYAIPLAAIAIGAAMLTGRSRSPTRFGPRRRRPKSRRAKRRRPKRGRKSARAARAGKAPVRRAARA